MEDLKFNPDWLDFNKGVEAGRELERYKLEQEYQGKIQAIFDDFDRELSIHVKGKLTDWSYGLSSNRLKALKAKYISQVGPRRM